MWRMGDHGSFVRHVATGLSDPCDVVHVEECEGGWLVACGGSHAMVMWAVMLWAVMLWAVMFWAGPGWARGAVQSPGLLVREAGSGGSRG